MNFGNVLIIGDSYSTFGGYIPEGYAEYYPEKETNVLNVEETWWHMLMCETESKLILNNSWSGSTVCYTAYEGVDCSETSSFIFRLEQLATNGFFEKNRIDTVFVFGGTNDSWADSPIGELKYADWEKKDLYSVLPAMCFLLYKLKLVLPNAQIVCVINTLLKDEITDGFKTACKHFGVKAVIPEDIEKINGHPTVKGMQDIKNSIIRRCK